MTILILAAAFTVLVVLGIPIAFAMGISSLIALLQHENLPFNLIVHRTMMGVDSFVLLAIPLFIFAGTIMEQGGISEKLVRFAHTLLGRFRGGLPMVVVGSTMLQSGISGSTVADVSAMSSMTLKPLEAEGYPRPYSLSVIGASCAFAILIPPCILMVIVAAVANTSVVAVFAAGILPSIVLGAMMLAFVHIQARMEGKSPGKKASAVEMLKGFKDALLALGVPILIFGGIRAGVATVTEMAAVAVIYSLLVGGLVYRRLTWKRIYAALVETCISTGVITMLIGFAMIFGYLLATEGVPQAVANWIRVHEVPAWGVLVITALIFVLVGSGRASGGTDLCADPTSGGPWAGDRHRALVDGGGARIRDRPLRAADGPCGACRLQCGQGAHGPDHQAASSLSAASADGVGVNHVHPFDFHGAASSHGVELLIWGHSSACLKTTCSIED
ncbi:TRAP transporter large permease [Comamonas odontotermitis]